MTRVEAVAALERQMRRPNLSPGDYRDLDGVYAYLQTLIGAAKEVCDTRFSPYEYERADAAAALAEVLHGTQ